VARLEDLTPGARVTGVVAGQAVTVVAVQWHGTAALTLTYRDDAGRPGEQLLYRVDEPTLGIDLAGPSPPTARSSASSARRAASSSPTSSTRCSR